MPNAFRRAIARIQFKIDALPAQMVHLTLSNDRIRNFVLQLLEPFPGVKFFLKNNVNHIQLELIKKRILYQRKVHPTMILNKKGKQATLDPKLLTALESKPRSAQDILQRIEQELR